MLFSIITVCYNSANTIKKTFDSVLEQSCKDYEFLIIDGGSSDGTLQIIKEYEPIFEGRMYWISERDNGIYDAMNKGIKLSKGDYLNFLNSDDYLENEALEKIKEVIKENSFLRGVFYGITRVTNAQHEEMRIFRNNHQFLHDGTINHQACYFHRTLFEEYGYFDDSYKLCADYKFLLTLKKFNVPFVTVDFIVVNYFSDGLSRKQSSLLHEENERLNVELGYLTKESLRKQKIQRKVLNCVDNSIICIFKCINKIYKLIFRKN